MAIELRQELKLTQQLVMTPQLQLAIRLLQLSRLELQDTIQQELEQNPVLEEVIEESSLETDKQQQEEKTESPDEVVIGETIPDDIDWRNYIEEYNTPGRTSYEFERKEHLGFEHFLVKKQSLQEHLLWQLMMTGPDSATKQFGSLIVGNINADGYLDASLDEIARAGDTSPESVWNVLTLMQTFDPPGVCARDLKESLLIQAGQLGLANTLVEKIITDHLNHLENRNIVAICRALGVDKKRILQAVEIIQSLEPKPGRMFSDETPQHIIPDVYVYKYDQEFVILLNDNGLPRLRINALYRNCLMGASKVSAKEKEYIREKLRSATWLIRSVHQRKKTIYRVMESILRFQRSFFDKGVSHLKPMVLRDVADDIEMHESTISRVTTNKYVHTPQGIHELKFFFNSPIKRVHGEAVASASVKDKIKHIIDGESSRKPYSDKKISLILKNDNIDIARRTVAKYREILNILPSSKRKQLS
jgi:RNA polymerase sigma-54 factor